MSAKFTPELNDALTRADAHSPFLRNLMRRFPDLVSQLANGDLAAALAASGCEPVGAEEVPAMLRLARGRLALSLGIGDLAGALPLEQVVGTLSAFADEALDHAIHAAIEMVTPGEEAMGFAAIALGKHGSRELNYSSDIDPVLLFDPETLPRRARDEPVEAAVRIATRVIQILQARDGDGYVFRVDLRLRPNPEVTPIALPVEAAISYYESSALAWERAAYIRARACAGDVTLGQGFLDAIRPFVWRRALDFGAIKEIRAMSYRIRGHYAAGQGFGPGFDLKRGRGGIRECEFFAQIHQMIHGGRDPSLRAPATLDALASLAAAGRIAADEAETLGSAYRLYRTIEHRLQMVDDQQTHSLPKNAEALDGVARLHGLAGSADLLALLEPHARAVALIYDGLEAEPSEGLPRETELLASTLSSLGFDDPAPIAERIGQWRSGAVRALRTPAAHEALEAVLPTLTKALAGSADPLTAINRLDRLMEGLPSAINLFRLLEARPQLLKLLTDILSHAPTLASDLSRRAELLDGLIDATALDPPGSVVEISERLRADDPRANVEERLDRVRRIVGEIRFALGAQIMLGASDPLAVAAGYARVAEAAIVTVADTVIAEFQTSHGRVPDSEFLILALGRMGGAELTHASDLDLIYLFTGDFASESEGPKPLGAVQYYNRLAQRVSAGLSVPTAAGPLYEVDTRLRPSGAQGPLVVSLDGFERYQREDAWTWEHMALCRARPVYGSDAARYAVQAILDVELARPRESGKVIADAVKMRGDMAAHKPPKGTLDVKLCEGGLVDLEFAVHVTQLLHNAGFRPQLGEAITELATAGLAPTGLAEAYRLLTRLLVTARLMAPDAEAPPDATCALIAHACGQPDWETLLASVEVMRQEVSAFWTAIKETSDAE
jgi:[glutamine synthetase] adenylyltransferase / [glutamine synthetase]-adenylyl-L-tyrosine phosphorylase